MLNFWISIKMSKTNLLKILMEIKIMTEMSMIEISASPTTLLAYPLLKTVFKYTGQLTALTTLVQSPISMIKDIMSFYMIK